MHFEDEKSVVLGAGKALRLGENNSSLARNRIVLNLAFELTRIFVLLENTRKIGNLRFVET